MKNGYENREIGHFQEKKWRKYEKIVEIWKMYKKVDVVLFWPKWYHPRRVLRSCARIWVSSPPLLALLTGELQKNNLNYYTTTLILGPLAGKKNCSHD